MGKKCRSAVDHVAGKGDDLGFGLRGSLGFEEGMPVAYFGIDRGHVRRCRRGSSLAGCP